MSIVTTALPDGNTRTEIVRPNPAVLRADELAELGLPHDCEIARESERTGQSIRSILTERMRGPGGDPWSVQIRKQRGSFQPLPKAVKEVERAQEKANAAQEEADRKAAELDAATSQWNGLLTKYEALKQSLQNAHNLKEQAETRLKQLDELLDAEILSPYSQAHVPSLIREYAALTAELPTYGDLLEIVLDRVVECQDEVREFAKKHSIPDTHLPTFVVTREA